MSGEWWRGAVMYQVYPRSFQDTDGDGVGDLKGVTQRLDHIRSLGVDGIWLSPFFKSPMRDFGYDVSDYCAVDPMFGDMADFEALVEAAHARDLKVIIDQVYAHCSADHAWFAESRSDRETDKADWFVWADAKPDGSPPNNWQAWFGGAAWTWEPRRRQYYLHNFLPSQPQLNLRSGAVQKAVLEIAKFWLERGVDGFRLDVANYYIHDAELRDNPPSGKADPALPRDMQIHQNNSNQPETLAFLSELRALTDSFGATMMVGELAPGAQPLMAEYTAGSSRLHTAYAFDFLGPWPGVERIAEILSAWGEEPDDGWPSWAFSNHDVARVASRWGNAIGAAPEQAAPLFMMLLLSLRGTIFLYQGEELGLPEADVPFEKLQDPWGLAGWPRFKGRDGCRTPMPWQSVEGAGFSDAEPWLPVDARHLALSVEAQMEESGSALRRTRSLIELRKDGPAMTLGGFKVLEAKGTRLAIERRAKGQRVEVAFNFGAEPIDVERPMWAYMTMSGGDAPPASAPGGRTATVAPFSWIYFRGKGI